VIKVEAGGWHSICLDSLGWLFGFGVNTFENRFEIRTNIPKHIDTIKFKVIDVFVGESMTVGVSKNGVPYYWKGCTGKPKEIEEVSGWLILDIVVGCNNTIIIT